MSATPRAAARSCATSPATAWARRQGDHHIGSAADGEDGSQPRRPADRGVRRLPRARGRPLEVLPRCRGGPFYSFNRPGVETPALIDNWCRRHDGRRQGLRRHQGVLGDRLTEDLKQIACRC